MTQKYEIPKAISLTDRAAERIKHIMSRAETPKMVCGWVLKMAAVRAWNTRWTMPMRAIRWTKWSRIRAS